LCFICKAFARVLCAYVLIVCSSKSLCGIAQLDPRYVIVCSAERMKVFSGVAWTNMGGSGTLQHGIRALVFNIEPRWAEKVQLKQNFRVDLFRGGQISSYRASSYNMVQKLGNSPNFDC
jgi:hypothetical protein